MSLFHNPVLAGFAPDPSICAVGEDFYLVTSTFAYFPGVPIYHSRDLVNWQQIGNVLEREEQLNLLGSRHSQGIYAPSIRYHDGVYYLTTTNVGHGGNFLVTATDPSGPWSEPYFIQDAPGIDPSLFFDVEKKVLIGVSTSLWKGALRDAIWPEGPHIYKKGAYYYLMIAEGGTGANHCITIARSHQIEGPYMGNPKNPILTHRHLGKAYPIQNVGHGDLIESTQGDWYLTCLASRMLEGYSPLGRETFLAEVVWEDDWPVVNPGHGKLLEQQAHPLPLQGQAAVTHYTFDQWNAAFLFLRNPIQANYDLTARPGWLRLQPTAITLGELDSPTYVGLRQQSLDYQLSARFNVKLIDGEAGLAVVQSDQYSIRLVVSPHQASQQVKMITRIAGEEKVVGQVEIESHDVVLRLEGQGHQVKASCLVAGLGHSVAEGVASHYLSTEVAGGFVGCTMGLYASSPTSTGYAEVEWLELENLSS